MLVAPKLDELSGNPTRTYLMRRLWILWACSSGAVTQEADAKKVTDSQSQYGVPMQALGTGCSVRLECQGSQLCFFQDSPSSLPEYQARISGIVQRANGKAGLGSILQRKQGPLP